MDKGSAPRPSILFLEVLFLGSLIFPPLLESLKVLTDLNFSPEQEYTNIMTGAVNPSIVSTITQGVIAVGMYLQFKTKKKSPFFLPYVFMLGFLTVNSFFWNLVTQIQGAGNFQLQEVEIQNPFLMFSAASVAAFYEEIVYRWFGPKILSLLFLKSNQGEKAGLESKAFRVKTILLEALLIVIFGLSHGYGGWTAVGNALIAGLGLRLCSAKTESPFPGFFAHLSYNFIQFFLLLN